MLVVPDAACRVCVVLTLYADDGGGAVVGGGAGVLPRVLLRQLVDGEASLSPLCPYCVSAARGDLLAVLQPLDVSFRLAELTA